MVELQLNKPIELSSGKVLECLNLDFDSLSTADFKAAQRLRGLISDAKTVDASKMMAMLRLDSEFQIAVGFIAACKGSVELSQADFLKLSMKDALLVGEAANDYFFA